MTAISQIIIFFASLTVILVVLATVGHVIWIVAAAIFRALFGGQQTAGDVATVRCPMCGRDKPVVDDRCPSCGFIFGGAKRAALERDLAATERQLHRFANRGTMTPEQLEPIWAEIREEQLRLRGSGVPEATEETAVEPAPAAESAPTPPVQSAEESHARVAGKGAGPSAEESIEEADESIETTPLVPEGPQAPLGPPPPERPRATVSEPSSAALEAGRPLLRDVLQAFLEERNIRWGELVSGVLIIGSAIGLVISLWTTLQEAVPYFAASVFLLTTAAIHFVGLYSLRRWRLKTTSRGLLLISTLLVPLNFLAAIALSEQRPVNDPLYLAAVAVGLVTYGAICVSAGRVLLPKQAWWVFVGVMGPSAGQLTVARLAAPDISTQTVALLMTLPLAAYLLTTSVLIRQVTMRPRLSKRRVSNLFFLLGIAGFSLLFPAGLLVWKTEAIRSTLAVLSPGLSLAATTVLGCGLAVHQRVTSRQLASTRTAGTCVALLGAILMVGSLVLAWPRPGLLISTGLANFVALTILAVRARSAWLHPGAVGSLALAGLIGFHVFQGKVSFTTAATDLPLLDLLLQGRSGFVLVIYSLMTVAAAVVLRQFETQGRRLKIENSGKDDIPKSHEFGPPFLADELLSDRSLQSPSSLAAAGYLVSGACLEIVSTLIAFHAGFVTGVDAALATPIFLLDSVVLLFVGTQLQKRAAARMAVGSSSPPGFSSSSLRKRQSQEQTACQAVVWIGSGLLLVGFVHGLTRNDAVLRFLTRWELSPEHPLIVAFLCHATLVSIWALTELFLARAVPDESAGRSPGDGEESSPTRSPTHAVVGPFCESALITSAVVLPDVLLGDGYALGWRSGYTFWAAGLWCLLAVIRRSRLLFVASQSLATVAAVLATTVVCRRQEWWTGAVLDPRHLQAELGMLGCWSLFWIAARQLLRKVPQSGELLSGERTSFDRILLGGVVLSHAVLAWAGALPGIAAELAAMSTFPATATTARVLMLAFFAALCLGTLVSGAIATTRKHALASFVLAISGLSALVLLVTGGWVAAAWSAAGVSHAHVYGGGGWIVLVIVIAALVCAACQRMTHAAVCGLLLAVATIPLLLAGRAASEQAAASVLRFSLAGYALIAALVAEFTRIQRRPAIDLNSCEFSYNKAVLAAGFRERISSIVERIRSPITGAPHGGDERIYVWFRGAALAVTVLPVLAITLQYTISVGAGNVPAGPIADSLFANVGPSVSYALPFWLLALVCGTFAVRDRRPMFALTASLFVQLGATVWIVLPTFRDVAAVGFVHLVQLLQWNALALAVTSLCWQAGREWIEHRSATPEDDEGLPPSALDVQVGLTMAVVLLLGLGAAVGIFFWPGRLPLSVHALGKPISYASLLLAAIGYAWHARSAGYRSTTDMLLLVLTVFLAHAAASTAAWNMPGNWLSYHTLMASWTGLTGILTVVLWLAAGQRTTIGGTGEAGGISQESHSRSRTPPEQWIWRTLAGAAGGWINVLGIAVVLLAVRAEWFDPQRPWWSAGCTMFLTVCFVLTALARESQRLAYVSTLLAMLSASLIWLRPRESVGLYLSPQSWVELVEANVIAAGLTGLVWMFIEILWQQSNVASRHWRFGRRHGPMDSQAAIGSTRQTGQGDLQAEADALHAGFDPESDLQPVHHAVAVVGLIVAAVTAVVCLLARTTASTLGFGDPVVISNFGGWQMTVTLGLLAAGCLWDRRARVSAACLYGVGLLAAVIALDQLALLPRRLLFAASCAAAGYALLTGLLWRLRQPLLEFGRRTGLPDNKLDQSGVSRWLPTANLALATFVVAAGFYVVLTFDEPNLRLCGALAAALLVPALACLADEGRRARFAFLALMAAAVAAVDLGWAVMPVQSAPHFWLHRSIRLLEVLAAMTAIYAFLLIRRFSPGSDWYAATRRAAATLGGGSLLALGLTLAMEAVWYRPVVGAPVSGTQIAIVAAVLVGLSAALIWLAVLPSRDPLGLSQRDRQFYVYAAEVVIALLFLHVRLTMPDLFRDMLLPYWPLVVMAIAYFGVGTAELLQRRGVSVLSEPLHRSGALLPLLPALGFWIHTSRSHYSAVLFIVGLLYVLLSMWRRSFIYSLAAALAGNGALWALLHEQGLTIFARPQMWLIPPALSVLVAAQINRRRLTENQLSGIRYLTVTVIYVSSTGEMFITGVAESLALPMVLAGLSVLGVFAGLLMRIRAFLYVGSSFLLLSIVSMVWHAAQNIGHVWPWWAFGIGLGLAILTLFGVFEKKRKEVLLLVDELRHWER